MAAERILVPRASSSMSTDIKTSHVVRVTHLYAENGTRYPAALSVGTVEFIETPTETVWHTYCNH